MSNPGVTRMIETSIRENRIVTVPRDVRMAMGADVIADDLSARSDNGGTANGDVIEYWGTDDDGDEWRVHLEVL